MLSRLFSTMVKPPITITTSAWDKMTEITAEKNTSRFIFSTTSGGCNGFNYDLKLLDTKIY